MNVDKEKKIKEAVSNMSVSPLEGDTWVTHIRYNAKDFSNKSIEEILPNRYGYGMVIIWVKEYRDLMRLIGNRNFNKYKHVVPVLKYSFLDKEDMKHYYIEKVPEEFRLTEKLWSFVESNYRFDPVAFTLLVSLLQGGRTYESTKELIEEIGLGRSSVETLVFKLLTTSTVTKKGLKRLFAESILFIENLKTKYEYRSIVNFINYALDTIIEIKLLQIRGLYKNVFVAMPEEGYDLERIAKMKRYDRKLEDITLIDALNLRLALMKSWNSDGRIQLMTALSYYADYLYAQGGGDAGELERQRLVEERKEKRKRQKEELKAEMEGRK